MKVSIKSFDVKMEIKTNGVELAVRDNKDNFLGDCIITKTGLIWCQGRTQRQNGRLVKWRDFIGWIESA